MLTDLHPEIGEPIGVSDTRRADLHLAAHGNSASVRAQRPVPESEAAP
jgi:hypothetical protein